MSILIGVLLLFSIVSSTIDVPVFADTTASLKIRSIDLASQSEFSGMWVSVYNSTNNLISSGFTPHYYNLTSSGSYRIDFSNYGLRYFTTTNATSSYDVVSWGGSVDVELDHTTTQVVDGFYFNEENPGSYVKMTFLDEDMETGAGIGGMSVSLKNSSGNVTLTRGFTPYTVGALADTELKIVRNNYGPHFYTESLLAAAPPGEEIDDEVLSWGGVQRINLPTNNVTAYYNSTAIYGPEEQALAKEYLQIIADLDELALSINGTSVSTQQVSYINSTLVRLEEIVVDLQDLGYDGIANVTRIDQVTIGTVQFYDKYTSELLLETQIPNGTLGIFLVMGMSKEFSAAGFPISLDDLADILSGSLAIAQAISALEDAEIASDFVSAGIGAYHPSTGNTFFVLIPILLLQGFAWCLSTPACENAILSVLDEGAKQVVLAALHSNFPEISIDGTIFEDVNGNGTRDDPSNELGLETWEVRLTTNAGIPTGPPFTNNLDLAQTFTNSSGYFNINAVRVPIASEKIIVYEILQQGWEATTPGGDIQEINFTLPFNPDPLLFGNREIENPPPSITVIDTNVVDTTTVVRSGDKIYVSGAGANAWRDVVSVYSAANLTHLYDIDDCAYDRCGYLFHNPYSDEVFVYGGGTSESDGASTIHKLDLNGPNIINSTTSNTSSLLFFMNSTTAIYTDSTRRLVYFDTVNMTTDRGTPYFSGDCNARLRGYDPGDNLVWIYCANSPYELRVMSPQEAYNAQQGIQTNSFSHSYAAIDPENNQIFLTQTWYTPGGRVYHFNGTAINLMDTFTHTNYGAVGRQVVLDTINDRYAMVDQKENKIWFLDRYDVNNVLGTITATPDMDLGWAPLAQIFWFPEGDGNLFYVGQGGTLTKFAVVNATSLAGT